MKPNFALSLSFEGIRLLHRSGRSWQLVGEVPLDSPDLAGALSVLRSTASALDKSGVRCKLILPNDQIKYLSLNHAVAGKAGVRSALEGATPYAVDELAYDWVVHEGVTQIAAVAKETLDEAEQFATDHRFNPVSFVALPEDGAYAGEPFFGVTRASAHLLEDGEEVERDDTPPPRNLEAPVVDAPVVEADIPAPAAPSKDTGDATPAPSAEVAVATEHEVELAVLDAEPVAEDLDAVEEDTEPTPAPSFASIRASRTSGDKAKAPKLEGATRQGDRATAPDIPVPGGASGTAKRRSRISFGFGRSTKAETDVAEESAIASGADGAAVAEEAPSKPRRKMIPLPEKRMARPDFADKPVPQAVEAKVGGKPRYLGLILTVVLLLFLAGVAAWAAVFVEDGLARFWRSPDKIDAPAVVEVVTPEPELVESPVDTGGVDFAMLEPAPEVTVPVTPVLPDPIPEPVVELPHELTPEEAAARYAVTGIWQKAPGQPGVAAPDTLDDLYMVSIDRKVPELDAVALPGAETARTDRPLSLLTSPPAPDATFALGEDGLVIPTPGGALAPEGYTVFLGQPPRVPPATPERVAPLPEASANEALAGYRPKLRPERLIENNERLGLGGRSREELAGIRPKLRPERPEPAQVAAVKPTSAETETAAQSATIAFVTPPKKPKLRPKDLAARNTAPKPTMVASASAAATVQPRIPSATSVTRAATVQNAINLRKVNLIGVYGKPDSRRALVRLKNGRYKKVKVGDRMDGGRVAAISADKLSYKKGGRNIVLKLP